MSVYKHSDAYRALKEYMRGWKHGAAAAAKLSASGSYSLGYGDGTNDRISAQKRAAEAYGVGREEMMTAVLR